jgi:hypothetical protein
MLCHKQKEEKVTLPPSGLVKIKKCNYQALLCTLQQLNFEQIL